MLRPDQLPSSVEIVDLPSDESLQGQRVRDAMQQAERRRNLSPRQLALLAAYRQCAHVTRASQLAGVTRTTHYAWLKENADYRDAFQEAEQEAAVVLEEEAHRRAVLGVLKPVYQGGQLVGYETVYSDRLLELLMIGKNPNKYGKRNIGFTDRDGRDLIPISTVDAILEDARRSRGEITEGE